ncbi:MAG: substrate-binding domain-containing protein [Verrucomicrobia bacterium]|nr:substrate-binding domain-containing protein [Verrucomicrobiota bacterium]MCH8511203.1 substrate-binding domain-containing protein [Kiritimatiellia bacterium]
MNFQPLVRFLALFSAMALTLFVAYFFFIFTLFGGGGRFYTPLVLVITVVLLVFEVVFTYWRSKRRLLVKLLQGFGVVCVLAVAGRMTHQAYHGSFAVVDTEVDIRKYDPFRPGTLAVSLDEAATLRLEGDLPRLDGATALYPVYAAFVRATYPEGDYGSYNSVVQCTKTGTAYDRLIKGQTDMIFVARPSQAHLDMAEELGVELILTPIGREAFVFFVNEQNEVRGLTTEQIQGIYSGEITNWRDVGGANQAIRPFQRPENSGSQTMLQTLMEGKTLMEPPTEDVVAGMGGIINQTANYRNYRGSIGYSFRFFASEMVQEGQIRFLEVDGVAPTRENIANDTYPLSTNLYAITTPNSKPQTEKLLAWILSDQGQEIVKKTGYTPIQ